MRISDWSSDVCSSDLKVLPVAREHRDILGEPAIPHQGPAVEGEAGIESGGERAEEDLENQQNGERYDAGGIARGPGAWIVGKPGQVQSRPHPAAKDQECRRQVRGEAEERKSGV